MQEAEIAHADQQGAILLIIYSVKSLSLNVEKEKPRRMHVRISNKTTCSILFINADSSPKHKAGNAAMWFQRVCIHTCK